MSTYPAVIAALFSFATNSTLYARAPAIDGVIYHEFEQSENLRLPPHNHNFRYEHTVDPLLIELKEADAIRNNIMKHRASDPTFLPWYYAHFPFNSGTTFGFDSFIRGWRHIFEKPFKNLKERDFAKAFHEMVGPGPMYRGSGSRTDQKRLKRNLRNILNNLQKKVELIQKAKLDRTQKRHRICEALYETESYLTSGNPMFRTANQELAFILSAKGMFELVHDKVLPRSSSIVGGRLHALVPDCHLHSNWTAASDKEIKRKNIPVTFADFEDFGRCESNPDYRAIMGELPLFTPENRRRSEQVSLPRCKENEFIVVLPKDISFYAKFEPVSPGSTLSIYSTKDDRLLFETKAENEIVEMRTQTPITGEYRLRLRHSGNIAETVTATTRCSGRNCIQTPTRYPIVMLHGMAGRQHYLKLIYYWDAIPETLGENGDGYQIYFPHSLFIGKSTERAPIAYTEIQKILDQTGAKRIHLIGHSQGGLDARVLAAGLDMARSVASITTLGTPHQGLRMGVIHPIWTGMDFREPAMARFNRRYPIVPGVPVLSYAAQACGPWPFDSDCRSQGKHATVRAVFLPFFKGIRKSHDHDPNDGANDGAVPIQSAVWGQFQGLIRGDHLDFVWGRGSWDPVRYLREQFKQFRRMEKKSALKELIPLPPAPSPDE